MVVGAISTIDYKKFIDLPSKCRRINYVLAKGKSSNFIKNFGDGIGLDWFDWDCNYRLITQTQKISTTYII